MSVIKTIPVLTVLALASTALTIETVEVAAVQVAPAQTKVVKAPERPAKVTKVSRVPRTPQAARSHARKAVGGFGWDFRQYRCLDKLWTKESNWRPDAQNKIYVDGKRAGGIPQILGLNPKSPVEKQILRGFKYIKHRYGTPCAAWNHWQKRGWY